MNNGPRFESNSPADGLGGARREAPMARAPVADLLPDPSARLVNAFRAAAARMTGLSFVNPALGVEAVGFGPWQGHWLGLLITPWFMNLIVAPRDLSVWQSLPQGGKRHYRFPAGDYEFIGAHDDLAGEYQMCSLFSPVLQFDDQETARLVAQLARDALFDTENADETALPLANLSPGSQPASRAPGPLETLEARLGASQSKRDFVHGRLASIDRGNRR